MIALDRAGRPPYAVAAERLAEELATSPTAGLTAAEARRRLEREGPNRLSRPAHPAYAAIGLRQLTDPLVGLLLVAAVVSTFVGEGLEAIAIAAIVVLNAALGFVQEVRAERAVIALREGVERHADVVRDGHEHEIPVDELVRGDLVVLREGDRVPADCRLLGAEGLEIDESLLTGESMPVSKTVAAVAPETPLAERAAMAYSGTGVTRGRGSALVTATGDATETGEVARLTARAKPPPTPLQRRLRSLARAMVVLGTGITLLLALAMLASGEPASEAFLVGVAVAVAAVPEGLVAAVTVALALGARDMAARGAIVRRLAAVETLGSATVVASDKTGTLTENRLRLVAVSPQAGRSELDVILAGVLASTAELIEDDEGVRVAGDPVEGAFLFAARDRELHLEAVRSGRTLVQTLPFEPERKRMTMVYEEPAGFRAFVKGAPETLLARSNLPEASRRELAAKAEAWGANGLRVLAVAERPLERLPDDPVEIERDLDVLGLVGMHDPLRANAPDAVAEAREAGLAVRILTGDHPVTARAIGAELGIAEEDVFSRVTPADKLGIVEGLQEGGDVVAVTGDGVNDAPALRRADIGVAMGRSGTEGAREAADIVLTDDDFSTIVAAIRTGRAITDNVRKFVAFLLSANLGEVVLFAIAILAGLGTPMTVVQILLVNVLTDGLPAVALARDPAARDAMRRGPRPSGELLPRPLWAALAAVGALVGLAALGAFLLGREAGPDEARTMAFATVALAELGLVFAFRAPLAAAWRGPRNLWLRAGVAASTVVVGAAVYVPPLHEPLGTTGLTALEAGLVLALAAAPLLVVEAAKAGVRRLRAAPH